MCCKGLKSSNQTVNMGVVQNRFVTCCNQQYIANDANACFHAAVPKIGKVYYRSSINTKEKD